MTDTKLKIVKSPITKGLHICSVCDKVGKWNKNWQWYGSYNDIDDGKEITKTCSEICRKVYGKTDIEKQPKILGE